MGSAGIYYEESCVDDDISSPWPYQKIDPQAIDIWACGCIFDSEGNHLSHDAISDLRKKVTFIQIKCFNHQGVFEPESNPQDIYLWACGCTFDKDGKPISFDPSMDALDKVRVVELICNNRHDKPDSPYSEDVWWDCNGYPSAEGLLPNMEIEPASLPQVKHVTFSVDPPVRLVDGLEMHRLPPRDVLLTQDPEANLRPIDLLRKVKGAYPEDSKDSLLNKSMWSKQKRDPRGR
jgi:hypothetical protein